VRLYVLFVMRRIQEFFNIEENGADMQQGELIVVGADKVEIILGHRHPKEVSVFFEGEPIPVPCNPHHDKLHWEIHNKHQHHSHDHKHDHCKHQDEFVLIIHWNVANVRVIKWVVWY